MSHSPHHKRQNEEISDDRIADLEQEENDSSGKKKYRLITVLSLFLILFYLLNN